MASPSSNETNATSEQDPAAGVQATPSRLSNFLRNWIVYRLPAALIWLWFTLRLTSRSLPFDIPLNLDYLVVPFLLVWVVLILSQKWLRAVFYLPYLLTFPLLILITLGWWVFRFFKTTLVVPVQAFRIARSGAAIFVTSMAILVGWTITLLGSKPNTQAAASLAAHAGLYLLFLQSFRWASNPYRPLLASIEFISEKGRKFFEKFLIEPAITEAGSKKESALKACDWCLRTLDRIYQAKAPLKLGLLGFTYGNLLPSFVYGFILVYCLLAFSFSVTLYQIERAWGPIISGLGDDPSGLSYFYFSFLTQATAIPNGVGPLSAYGQLWILWLVMTGILLLTILIALFTTSLGVHGGNALTEVRAFSEGAKRDLIKWRGELTQAVIDVEIVDSNSERTASTTTSLQEKVIAKVPNSDADVPIPPKDVTEPKS